jgi:subtilisin family serine protease
MTDIVDGLNYIYDFAESQGKPAVANLSWGCSIGPHDGSSLFSQAVDNLTGPGRIFTISAGNNGENKIHIHKSFSDTDTLVGSLVGFSNNLAEKKTWLDIWGDSEEFSVQLRLYGGAAITATTDFMPLDGSTIDTFLIGDDNDTFFFKMTGVSTDINGKPHAFLDLYSKTVNDVAVSVKAKGGEINMWIGYVLESSGYYGLFYTNGHPWASPGDTDMTIGEMGCTESAITVAAYASKTGFTNLSGSSLSYSNYVGTDKITPFSSRGPTATGAYIKPDIAAPGLTLASAVNSSDLNYAPGGANYNLSVFKHTDPETNVDYYFAEAIGTSMSAPMTAGIVALMLQANPSATPSELKMLMAETAIKDTWTTANPEPSIWGVGKINAYGMMKTYFQPSAVANDEMSFLHIYPNPATDQLYVDAPDENRIVIYNMLGKLCLSQPAMGNNSFSIAHLAPGMYVVKLLSSDNQLLAKQKLLKL